MDPKHFDDRIDELLFSLSSMPGLQSLVDDLTADERDLLNQVDFFTEPSDEDLQDFGPDFVEELLETTLQRYRVAGPFTPLKPSRWTATPRPSLGEGLELLRLLAEVDERAVLKASAFSPLTDKMVELAGSLADMFTEEIDRALVDSK